MKHRIVLLVMLSALMIGAWCNMAAADPPFWPTYSTDVKFDPPTATPGQTISFSYGHRFPFELYGCNANYSQPVQSTFSFAMEVWWHPGQADAALLGSSTVAALGGYGRASGQFVVPSEAAAGPNVILFKPLLSAEESCYGYRAENDQFTTTVDVSTGVGPVAYLPVADRTALPSTGLALLLPTAGIGLGGLGALTAWYRRRR
jgi:hypothetical protein